MVLGRSRLLHGADKDALADGQQVELGKEEAGDVAHAAFRVGEQAENAVVVHVGNAGAYSSLPYLKAARPPLGRCP